MTGKAIKAKLHRNRDKKLVQFKDLQKLSKKLKSQGKKIVFTTGSFDLLNPGQCRYLAEAKAKGDVLVVGVSTDSSERFVKGPEFPLVNEDIRAEMISFLKTVDYVTLVDEKKPHAVLILLQPDIFFTTSDSWNEGERDLQEKALVKMYGGKIIKREKHLPYFGNRELVEHIADIRVLQILEKFLSEKLPGFKLDPLAHLKPADFGPQKCNDPNSYDCSLSLTKFSELEELGNNLRKQGKSIVFVSGSYDLLHVGHARFVQQAALQGDALVVGIPSDKSLRELKGIGRPVISEYSRAYVLAHLEPVDHVVIFESKTVLDSLEALKPDVFFTVEEDWNDGYKLSPEYKLMTKLKGKVVRSKRQAPFMSASSIIDKAAHKKVRDIFIELMDTSKYQRLFSEK